MCLTHGRSYLHRVIVSRRRHAVVLLLVAVGLVACTDDNGHADPTAAAGSTVTTVAPATTESTVATTVHGSASTGSDLGLSADEEAEFDTALALARCLRDHGIEGLPDPQLSGKGFMLRSEEHTSELQSLRHLVCRLL